MTYGNVCGQLGMFLSHAADHRVRGEYAARSVRVFASAIRNVRSARSGVDGRPMLTRPQLRAVRDGMRDILCKLA